MTRKIKCTVPFQVLYELHPLKAFQEAGHFVPALRERTATGQQTRQPRKWKGKMAHCLTLLDPHTGEPARLAGSKGGMDESEVCIARVISDSLEDAERLFADTMAETFFGQKRALEIVSFNAEQLRKSADERTQLLNALLSNGGRALAEEALQKAVEVRMAEDAKLQEAIKQCKSS